MKGLTDGVMLYHGSYCEVQSPDLEMHLFSHKSSYRSDSIFGERKDMVIEKELTDEAKKNAIDLMTTMVVTEIAQNMNISTTEALERFLLSNTGKLLFDEESKLWWDGPSSIAEMFEKEAYGMK